jgi:hypothetical protein
MTGIGSGDETELGCDGGRPGGNLFIVCVETDQLTSDRLLCYALRFQLGRALDDFCLPEMLGVISPILDLGDPRAWPLIIDEDSL